MRYLLQGLLGSLEAQTTLERVQFATPHRVEEGLIYNVKDTILGGAKGLSDVVLFNKAILANASRITNNTVTLYQKAFADLNALLNKEGVATHYPSMAEYDSWRDEDTNTDDDSEWSICPTTDDWNLDADKPTIEEILFVVKGDEFYTDLIGKCKGNLDKATFIANLMGLPIDIQMELIKDYEANGDEYLELEHYVQKSKNPNNIIKKYLTALCENN